MTFEIAGLNRHRTWLATAGLVAVALLRASLSPATAQVPDPLPSWNEGSSKRGIVEFVGKVTGQGGTDFVPPAERIATFDNDGTLWAEQPLYFQFLFAIDRLKALAPQHPEWTDKEPFASLLKGDVKAALAGGEHALVEIVMATHAGMTTDEFEKIVKVKEGERKINDGVANLGKEINGWRVASIPGDSAHYNGDWLKRAVAAKAGIYGNDAVEAMYPLTRTDSDGQPLDGSKHDYTLTFPPGQQPPVNSFWSLTMYDGNTQLLIENPISRYLINSPMLPRMKTNADGSLTLYIQSKLPGPDKEANWLPAPSGPIYLVMRLYWPKADPPSILPPGEGTWRPPGVKRVS
jgi:hypothetical protein